MSLADWTGWIAAAAMGTAAVVPLAQRVLHRRRADLGSGSVRLHVAVGMTAAGAGFLHPLTALFSLGSPEAIGGGVLGLAFGGVAFVVLLAHTGLGLKLRDPKLRHRPRSRRTHLYTALTIIGCVAAHAAACLYGGS